MPIIPFLAKVAASAGVGKVLKTITNNEEAAELLEEAQKTYEKKLKAFESQRKITLLKLSKLERMRATSYKKNLEPFINDFSFFDNLILIGDLETHETEKLNNYFPQEVNFEESPQHQNENSQIAKKSAIALGGGALMSAAAYKMGAKKGTSSTGKKISSLNGVAAKNATLAWLGGGSKGSGGTGMLGGKLVLGGIALAPALVVASSLFNCKSEENLKNATKIKNKVDLAVDKMREISTAMETACKFSAQYMKLLRKCEDLTSPVFTRIQQIKEYYYTSQNSPLIRSQISPKEERLLNISSEMAEIYYLALSTPLLDDHGNLHFEAEENLKQIKAAIPVLKRLKAESEHLSENGSIVYSWGNNFPWSKAEKAMPIINCAVMIVFIILSFALVKQGAAQFFATIFSSLILFPGWFKAKAFLPQFRTILLFARLSITVVLVLLSIILL